MAVIFEGTFEELQHEMQTLALPRDTHLRLEVDWQNENTANGEIAAAADHTAAHLHVMTLDEVKERSENDDEYFLRFYRTFRP